jgi:hypothetical protein
MEATAGRGNASRVFDVLKGASLRGAHSDWTAARFLGDAMVALHGVRFVLPRMLVSLLSESTDG